MLAIPHHLEQKLLDELNTQHQLIQTENMLHSEKAKTHFGHENERYDTSFSGFHRMVTQWMDDCLTSIRRDLTGEDAAGYWLLGSWYCCDDVFAVTSATADQHPWTRNHLRKEGTLLAFRLSTTLFYYSSSFQKWKSRPWRGNREPLMYLPYQRKYDSERNSRADDRARTHYMMLSVAKDILQVLQERIDEQPPDEFSPPPLEDIQQELKELGLSLGIDGLGGMIGGFGLELLELKPESQLWSQHPQAAIVETGHYRGVLGGYHRRSTGALRMPPSLASQKWIMQRALKQLQEKLTDLTSAGGDR